MIIFGAVFLQLFLSYQTAAQQQTFIITGEKGSSVLLTCFGRPVNSTLKTTTWKKSGEAVITRNHSLSPTTGHFSILDDGSLNITDLMILDEDTYECTPDPENKSLSRIIVLQVTDGPSDMDIDIKPGNQLSNGTLYVQKGENISFNCSSDSYPSPNLTWIFEETSRAFGSGSSLNFGISNIQPADQGNYICKAQNPLSNRTMTLSQELLVYYVPDRHPNCSWEQAGQPDLVSFICSWHGGYPTPVLQVVLNSEPGKVGFVRSNVTDSFEVTLNRTMMHNGQNITCRGRHMELQPGLEKSCFFTLQEPYPKGEPLVATLEDSNVTLTCTEDRSLPAAKTVWQRGDKRELIVPSSKYILTTQGPVLSLTIVNVTKNDEGVYFCWSENALAAKALEVYLTVRLSATRSGVMFGVFLSVIIVVAGIALGLLGYSRRDRICLRFGFGDFGEDRADMISLVESEEEEVFHNAVPKLPTVNNGHTPTHGTALVEIHRIQSSDHDDNVNEADQDQITTDE